MASPCFYGGIDASTESRVVTLNPVPSLCRGAYHLAKGNSTMLKLVNTDNSQVERAHTFAYPHDTVALNVEVPIECAQHVSMYCEALNKTPADIVRLAIWTLGHEYQNGLLRRIAVEGVLAS